MPATYDGAIRISTKIDTKGVNAGVNEIKTGISSLTNGLKGFAAAAGVAFGVAAIVNFGKSSIKAASDLKSALKGLKSISDGMGKSFSSANTFIQKYISDGLVPATDAVTAYKNLLMRGYSTDQIENVMIALKNSAAFGRQASLTMGEAVSSATEGLKNENSILVDNSGVTKNVSMMWKDYAKSIGVGVDSLNKQQKIQAEVTGIMQETRFQTGDAAKMAGTYAGQVSQLSFNFNNLKIAIGNALMPLAQAVLPGINAMITGLTRVANLIAQISTALFGQAKNQQKVVSDTSSAVQQQEALTDATNETAKAAQGATASFDDLNILSKVSTSPKDSGSGTPKASGTEIGGDVTVSSNVQTAVEKLKSLLAPLQDISFDNLSKSFERLKKALEPFTQTLFSSLYWAYQNIFVPLAKFTIEDVLPHFLDTLALAVSFAGKILDECLKTFQTFYDSFLKPVAEYTGKKFIEFWDKINKKISEFVDMVEKSEAFEDFRSIIEKIGPPLAQLAKALSDIYFIMMGFISSAVFDYFKKNFKDMEDRIGFIADLLNGDFSSAMGHLKDLMVDNKVDAFKDKLNTLKDTFGEVKDKIVEWGSNVGSKMLEVAGFVNDNLIKPIVVFFTGLWNKIVEIFTPICDWFNDNVIIPIVNIFSPIVSKIGEIFAKLWEIITTLFSVAANWFNDNVIIPIINFFSPIVKIISNFFSEAWNKIADIFKNVGTWFGNRFTEAWESVKSAFSSVKDFFSDVWGDIVSIFSKIGTSVGNAIGDAFKTVVNTIIGFAEKNINGFIDGIDNAIDIINNIPGVKISPIEPLKIPRLAAGAVIPPNREFMAVLGDQKNGRNIETPEDLLAQIVRDNSGIGSDAVIDMLQRVLDAIKGQNLDVKLYSNDREIARASNRGNKSLGYSVATT